MKIRKISVILFILGVVLFSCEDTREGDTLPPAVSVLSPHPGDDVSGIVAIKVLTEDDSGILKVDFYVNNTLLHSDSIAPYIYDWNTENYLDDDYVINIHSWDNEGNVAKADPVHVRIANQSLYNLVINITSIKYVSSGFAITWEQSTDNDFDSYTLLKSQDPIMSDADTIYYTRDISSVEYFDSDIAPSEYYYYRIMVKDTFGLQVAGKVKDAYSFVVFSKTYGGLDQEIGESVQQALDGGYIITGFTESYGDERSNVWLVKTNLYGEKEWSQVFGGSSFDRGYSVQQTTDGGFIIGGYTYSIGNGNDDVWLIKTDSQGNEAWNKTFGGSSSEEARSVQQTTDGGYIILGQTGSIGNGGFDIWLINTDEQGNKEWDQTFGGSDADYGSSIQQTYDGGFIILGMTYSYGSGDRDAWLIKTDSKGDEEWSQVFGSTGWDGGHSVQQTLDGGYIITGHMGGDLWLVKFDTQGNEEWNQTFNGSIRGWGKSVKQTPDGGYIITGEIRVKVGDYYYPDVLLLKTDSQGNMEWRKAYGGDSFDVGKDVQIADDGGYIIVGYKQYSSSFPDQDFWLIKTDPQGNTVSYE